MFRFVGSLPMIGDPMAEGVRDICDQSHDRIRRWLADSQTDSNHKEIMS